MSIVFKAKTKENMKKHFFMVFISKLKNSLFWGSNNKKKYFFSFNFENNRHTNVILISIFKNAQENSY